MSHPSDRAVIRALHVASASGRFTVTLPPGALLRRAAGDCPASFDPARTLHALRRRAQVWAARASGRFPAWLNERRNVETSETEEIA